MLTKNDLIKINDYLWEIPQNFRQDMKVPARIYADEKMLNTLFKDESLDQLVNVSTLPGIIDYALAMPDIHEGYGFPIGGVAATSYPNGVISPGGVGFDINCGVRILKSPIAYTEIKKYLEKLMDQIQIEVPSGVGRSGRLKLDDSTLNQVLEKGVSYLVAKGYGKKEDYKYCEEEGSMKGALAKAVSSHAKNRGRDQLGTLGAGNHFLEVQRVVQIFDENIALELGIFQDQITIMIHSGSRGLGHQVCADYVKIFLKAMSKYKIQMKDPELASAPLDSLEGKEYFSAMSASANFAWSNRQMMMHLVRQAWKKVLGKSEEELNLIYDVAHNIAKIENHQSRMMNQKVSLCVHRKGATRAFGPGNEEIPLIYRKIGQPVLIPGTMGTASYILVGTEKAMKETWGSTCHGAGRVMSRHQALRQVRGETLRQQLEKQGIAVRCLSNKGLAEEAPLAYKDVHSVVDIVDKAGIAKKVAELRPIGVVKG